MTNMPPRLDWRKPRTGLAPLVVLVVVVASTTGRADTPGSLPADEQSAAGQRELQNVDAAVAWLSAKAKEMIRASQRTMKDGTAAFPPQVGTHYEAFWLRDYCYMLEGAIDAFSDRELEDACRLFVTAVRKDGAGVDCVKFNGTPIYKPGYGSMGAHAVADGSPFTVAVAWHAFRQTKDLDLLRSIIDKLELAMGAVPRNSETGLVHIEPGKRQERCPYGFTDSIPKQGDVLFCSLLYVQASRQMADLYKALDRPEEARRWSSEAERVAKQIRDVFWNPEWGLFRAATVKCNQPDIWGSAFAVSLGVADRRQALSIARYFRDHYGELVEHGQIRHLPRGTYWEGCPYRDRYQNGGYWATPVGWFVFTLDRVDPKLADQTILAMVRDFQRRGVNEWVLGDKVAVPGYLASISLPLADIRRMLARRRDQPTNSPQEPAK
ncbi:MAG: hypothetical protein JW888_04890 [Pirellulales bacterium]|nr:hypothetical protein [Pirellulales bacterium]